MGPKSYNPKRGSKAPQKRHKSAEAFPTHGEKLKLGGVHLRSLLRPPRAILSQAHGSGIQIVPHPHTCFFLLLPPPTTAAAAAAAPTTTTHSTATTAALLHIPLLAHSRNSASSCSGRYHFIPIPVPRPPPPSPLLKVLFSLRFGDSHGSGA